MKGENEDVDVYVSPRILAGQTPTAEVTLNSAQERSIAALSEVGEITEQDQRHDRFDPLQRVLNDPSLLGEGEPAYFYDSGDARFEGREYGYEDFIPLSKCEIVHKVLLNGVLAMLSLALITLGSWILLRSSTSFATYLREEGRVIRHVRLLAGLLLGGGAGLFVAAVVGFCALILRRSSHKCRKILFLVFEALIFICFVITALLSCIAALTLVNKSSGDLPLGQDGWILNVKQAPQDACDYERRFNCAGFAKNQCLPSSSNATLQAYCPGHFCTGQCEMLSQYPSRQTLCKRCIIESGHFDFSACKMWEARNSKETDCGRFIQEEVGLIFTAVLALCSTVCAWVVLSTLIIAIQMCVKASKER